MIAFSDSFGDFISANKKGDRVNAKVIDFDE